MADKYMELAVCGLHMRGMELEHQLLDLGGRFKACCKTGPHYRMKVVPGKPEKPFLTYCLDGSSLEVEVWELPVENMGVFLAGVPSPLALGKVRLESGEVVGFVGQAGYGDDYKDISEYGGWANYRKTMKEN